MNKVTIIKAYPEGVREIQWVFYKTWMATYPNEEFGITKDDIEDWFKDAFTEETFQKRAERIAHPLPGSILLVAKENEKIVGLCGLNIESDLNRVRALYVLPEYQGKGIGRLLWLESKKYFNPQNDIFVNVAVYNKNAIEFYKKIGFVETGKRFEDEKFRMKSGNVIPEIEMSQKFK